MGNTWTVYGWWYNAKSGEYEDCIEYAGSSAVAALWNAWQAKRAGCGRVKLEWR